MSTFNLANKVKIVNPSANVDYHYGPYDTVEDACIAIPEGLRLAGKTVGINSVDGIVEFWWKNGITDVDLVKKIDLSTFNNITLEFAPGSVELTKTLAQWASALGTYFSSINVNENIIILSTDNQIKLNSYFASNTRLISINSDIITELNTGAFYGCSNLEYVEFPNLEKCNGVESANGTFQNCYKLTSAHLPKLKYGATKLFCSCTTLVDISLPLLETVGWQTFFWCSKLQTVKIPLLRQMGLQMFYNCVELISVYAPVCEAIGYSLADNSVFYGVNSNNNIFELTVDNSLRTCNTNETEDGDITYLRALRTNTHVVYANITTKTVTNKSWVSMGDSITWYDSNRTYLMSKGYQAFVKDKLKFTTHTNYVKNGASVYEMCVFETDPANPQTPPPAAHIYTIMLSVNDMLESRTIGTINDYINSTGQGTFYGGYRMIIDRLKLAAEGSFYNAQIFPCTPIKAKNFLSLLPTSVYGEKANNTLADFRDAIIAIVNYEKGLSTLNTIWKHRLEVIDLYELTEFSEAEISQYFIDDTLHPNDKGNKIIADKIIDVLESTVLDTVGIGQTANNKAKLNVRTYEHELAGNSVGDVGAWANVIAAFSGDEKRLRVLLENRNVDPSANAGKQVTIIFQSPLIRWQIGTDLNQNGTNDFFIFDITSLKPRMYFDANGNVSIGKETASVTPNARLEVNGGVKIANDTATESSLKAGTMRYREDANNSYVEMCMKSGASSYVWEIIKQKTW